MARNRAEANKLAWMQTQQGLVRMRADLQLRGVAMSWKRIPGALDRLPKLLAELRGVAPKPDDHAALAMTLMQPLFPNAVIEGGGKDYDTGRWSVLLWLDAPKAEAHAREQQHTGLVEHAQRVADRKIHEGDRGSRRCPHDGRGCQHGAPDEQAFDEAYAEMQAAGTTPDGFIPPCHVSGCWRERRGVNLRTPYPGFPQPGHLYPSRRKG